MPIITPAFPCMNTAFNVSQTTMKILRKEFNRASVIIEKINAQNESYSWKKLFKMFVIFHKFSHFLRIDALSKTVSEHLKWEGFIESKLRLLILELEKSSEQIKEIKPCTISFDIKHSEYPICTTFLLGIKFLRQTPKGEELVVDLREPALKFTNMINSMAIKVSATSVVRVGHAKLDMLPKEIIGKEIDIMAAKKRALASSYSNPTKKAKEA